MSDIVCDKCGEVLVEGVPDIPAICGQCLSQEMIALCKAGSGWREELGWRGAATPYYEKPGSSPCIALEYVPLHEPYEYWLVWHSADGAIWLEGAFKDAPGALRAVLASRHRYTAWSEIYSVLAGARPEEALRYYIQRYAASGYETENKRLRAGHREVRRLTRVSPSHGNIAKPETREAPHQPKIHHWSNKNLLRI